MSWTARAGLAALALLLAVVPGIALAASSTSTTVSPAIWFAARAMGLTAYVLATGSVLFGLASATRTGNPKPGLGFVNDVHRALSLLTLVAIGGHVSFLALDQYARFGPVDLLVPFRSWYRPAWTGLGVVAAYLAVLVYASFYVRSQIGYRTWRVFHYVSFAIFAFGTIHGLLAGTDSSALWARAIYAGAITSVAVMFAYRLARGSGHQPAWAFEESSGDLGAVRAVLAMAVLFVALVAPVWMLARPSASTPTTAQPAASANTGSSAPAQSGGAQAGGGDEQSTVSVTFTGTADGSGSWRLLSETRQPLELDLAPPGALSLRDPVSGELLFEGSASVSSGQIHSLMNGDGTYAGYTLTLDGTYHSSGTQVQLDAQLTLLSGRVE